MMEQPGISSGRNLLLRYHTTEMVLDNWQFFKIFLLQGSSRWQEYETIDSLLIGIQKGSLQLWTVSEDTEIRLMAITRIDEYPTGRKELVIQYLMGARFFKYFEQLKLFLENFEVFARLNKCSVVKINAIEPIARYLRKVGYTDETVVVLKELQTKERMH